MENQNLNLYAIFSFLFDRSVWQGVWANFLFALIVAIFIFIIFSFANKRKIYKIFGLDKKNRLSIFFSNTFVQNAIDRQGNQNLYTGPAVPENEFKTIKELFNLLSLIGEKDNALVRFMKFLTFDVAKIECGLSPQNEIQVEANKETNILTIGGPGYNNATSYFQKDKTRLFFGSNRQENNVFVDRVNNITIAKGSLDYDYGILEKIIDENRVIILAYGFHINGTRGAVKYLVDNWKKLPEDFAYLIKFPHPSKDIVGYMKPLEVKNFKGSDFIQNKQPDSQGFKVQKLMEIPRKKIITFSFGLIIILLGFFINNIREIPFAERIISPKSYYINEGLARLDNFKIITKEDPAFKYLLNICLPFGVGENKIDGFLSKGTTTIDATRAESKNRFGIQLNFGGKEFNVCTSDKIKKSIDDNNTLLLGLFLSVLGFIIGTL